jgi:hypothetical protein
VDPGEEYEGATVIEPVKGYVVKKLYNLWQAFTVQLL